MVLLAGGNPVAVTTTAETGFKLKPEQLDRAITPGPVDHPQFAIQPDRRRLHARRVEGADGRAGASPHVWVMSDDMYEHLVYDDFVFTTPAQIEPRLYERTLTVNACPSYCMTGWRIGFAGGLSR